MAVPFQERAISAGELGDVFRLLKAILICRLRFQAPADLGADRPVFKG
jgi:hypothetical protein